MGFDFYVPGKVAATAEVQGQEFEPIKRSFHWQHSASTTLGSEPVFTNVVLSNRPPEEDLRKAMGLADPDEEC